MKWFTILKNKWSKKKNNVDNNENIEIVEQILWKKLELVGILLFNNNNKSMDVELKIMSRLR